ncbi:hypothetical protein [Hyphomicrobium sp. CS1GBMeth3]|uniref:hypothetical protein n=1 Tax=Hyphomicrobium sp. CS1GBMeth3 TaxID=1892845 RepID=UPI000930381B|nr:hypothetical protein [Hyphomicrobium sp. CS1GBMeth3]
MAQALQWIRDHDDRLSFVVLYIGGAIALSVWLNLFWVIMLMLGHFALEIARGYLLDAKRPLTRALWEVKLDIALVLFALVVALYSELVLGLLGLGQAARAGQAVRGLQAATRFGVIERALRIVVLTADDALRLVQAAMKFRNRSAEQATPTSAPIAAPQDDTDDSIGAGDIASLAFGALCLLLILLAPQFTESTPDDIANQLLQEISPHR